MKEVILNGGEVGVEFEDIAFCNTNLFTETAQYFLKNGVYTKAPDGTREFQEFWDIEEDRIKNGLTAPGKLVTNERGEVSIQEVHITGDHYAYLNYGQIKLTKDIAEVNAASEKIIKDITHTMVARKKVSFPSFWDGDYHYFKAKDYAERKGKNLFIMKARRKGYSYKNAFIVAKKALFTPASTSVVGAYDSDYLIQGDGTMVMARNYIDFIYEHTDYFRDFLNESKLHLQLGYKDKGGKIKKGYKSQIIGVSFMNNPDAAIGKDAELIIIDEAGKFPNLKEMFDVTQPTLEDGDIVIGIMVVFGTGGTKEANWEAFEHMYYVPEIYNGLVFNNVWDDGELGKGVGFFHSHALNLKPYIDKDGNSNVSYATELTLERREVKKKQATKATEINTYIGQRCLKPSEGFNRTQDNIFSSPELDEYVKQLSDNPVVKDLARYGTLSPSPKGWKFTYNDELSPSAQHPFISNVPHKPSDDVHGCFTEWFAPYRDLKTGIIPAGLYRVWVDPYAFDKDADEIRVRDSLGAIYVYERANTYTATKGDVLVACYVGRPAFVEEFNDMALRITKYYNAICCPEVDRGEVVQHFRRNDAYELLADEPEAFFLKRFTGKEVKKKGIKIGGDIDRKGVAAIKLKEWVYKVRDYDENGQRIYNFMLIKDVPLLKELQKWNLKGNFDRTSALLVGMYDREDVFNMEIKQVQETDPNDFFNRAFYG
jgi:hypothetical protein